MGYLSLVNTEVNWLLRAMNNDSLCLPCLPCRDATASGQRACDVERSVIVVFRCYGLHGQLVSPSKALTQIRLDIVSGDMTLKPSREDACETFIAGRLDTGAVRAAGNPLAGRVRSRRRCLPSLLTLRLTPTGD